MFVLTLSNFWVEIARHSVLRIFYHDRTHLYCTRLIRQLFPAAKVMSCTCSDLTSLYVQSYLRNLFYKHFCVLQLKLAASYLLLIFNIFLVSCILYSDSCVFYNFICALKICCMSIYLGTSMRDFFKIIR